LYVIGIVHCNPHRTAFECWSNRVCWWWVEPCCASALFARSACFARRKTRATGAAAPLEHL